MVDLVSDLYVWVFVIIYSRRQRVLLDDSVQPLREVGMSEILNKMKGTEKLLQSQESWLQEQTRIAAVNLSKRPVERRGPYTLTDEQLQAKFSSQLSDGR